MITYKKKLFLDWDVATRKKLRAMTILRSHGASGMIEAVADKKNPLTCVAFFNDVPIGWALLSKRSGTFFGEKTIMVYVKSAYRRQGIGTQLFKQLRKSGGKRVVVWNENSHRFWEQIKKKSKTLILLNYY